MMKTGKYHNVCLECDYEWDDDEEYNIQFYCPNCHQGDIAQELNTEYIFQNDFKGLNLNENNKAV